MTNKPTQTLGMHHLALRVNDLETCVKFYVETLGMKVEWQPDPDNVYLTSGNDNLALHRADIGKYEPSIQRLDHFGFILRTEEEVDEWHEYLVGEATHISATPKTHRDGARSFYCTDPDGNPIQFIYHPPISGKL